MIYLLSGTNSYHALRKIHEFKTAFAKKALPADQVGGSFLIEELDEENEISPEQFHSALSQSNLFSKTRLVIFRNVLESNPKIFEILEKNGDFLKNSKDVFVFWEKTLKKAALEFFKKYAEKIQEVGALSQKALDAWLAKKAQNLGLKLSRDVRALMMEEAGEGGEWALENELEKMALAPPPSSTSDVESQKHRMFSRAVISPFVFVERMFGPRALLALKEMTLAGIEPSRFIYALLWKLKQKKMADAYFRGILAESKMKRDPKNSYEILERFIFSLPDRQAGIQA